MRFLLQIVVLLCAVPKETINTMISREPGRLLRKSAVRPLYASLLCIAAMCVAMCAALCICVGPAFAQTSSTGALTGVITDPSGAVISGATVTLTSLGTGEARTVTTDASGNYKFALLPPGNYKLSVSASGFKTDEVPSVTVNVTETPELNRTLQVGAQSEQVTVESTVETIQTQNATNGQLVGGKEVTDLPLSSRNYTQVIDLSPGVVVNVSSAAAIGAGTQDINVNGMGSDQNNYLMDGATITNYGSGGGAQSGNYPGIGIPNPDSIQEFKVQTSQYDASFGQNPGANVNVVTKGGTNNFHGDVWEFNRNNFFNANDFFLKASQHTAGLANTPPTFKENQYGGTLGGPIKKDKLFFFGSYQGTRQINGIGTNGFSTGFTTVSLLPFNNSCGNRNDGCNGQTYRQYLGSAFGGQVDALGFLGYGTGVAVAPDGSNINQVAINILQAKQAEANGPYNKGYYIPSAPPGCVAPCTTSISDPITANEDQFLANFDYILSSKNTISERYFFAHDPQVQSFVCLGGCDPGAPEDATYTTHDGVLKLTTVVTNNFVNEARLSYQREVTNSHDGFNLKACDVGMVPMVNNGVADSCPGRSATANPELQLIPAISSLGFPGSPYGPFIDGGNFFAADTNYFNTFQYADQISWNHGKHAIRAGVEAQRIQWNWTLPGAGRGDIYFGNIADFLTSSSGAPNTGTTTVPNGIFLNFTTRLAPDAPNYHALRVNEFDSFVEDDIKVSRKLTLNLGVRWEYDGFPSDATGLFTNFWGSEAQLNNTGSYFLNNPAGTLAGYVVQSNYNPNATICGGPCGLTAPDGATGVYVNNNKTLEHGAPVDNFAPRVGLAWQPLGDRFVVRAGYGIFYDRIYGNLLGNNQQAEPPYAGSTPAVPAQSLDNPDSPGQLGWVPRTLKIVPVAGNGTVLITDATNGTGLTNNAESDSEFLGTPLIQEYNLDLQYEFLRGWVADIGYVGTHGTHLYDWARDVNIANLVAGAPNEPTDAQNLAMVRPVSSFPFNDPGNPNPVTTNTVGNFMTSFVGPGGLVSPNPSIGNVLGRVPILGLNPTGDSLTSTIGDSLYNSLQAQLRHQFSHGLLFQVSYTWSKLITNINSFEAGTGISAPGNVLSGGATLNDPNNLTQQYGLGAYNRPQRLVVSYSYDLPYRNEHGFMGKAFGGWTLSGVTTAQDGEPFSIEDTSGGSIYYGAATGVRAELADPVNCNSQGVCQSGIPVATPGSVKSRLGNYINQAAFVATPCIGGTVQGACATSGGGTSFGDSGVGIISGPGQFNWDMSIIKNTKITEGTSLQFRTEFYNAFNHAQFDPPGDDRNTPATYGVITQSSVPPRIIQFGLKFLF
jgi:hypothetical protein